MGFDLTVLGSSGSHTAPGQACSGYLLRSDDTQVMLDCGNGSTANLQLHTSFEDLDAVVVTHMHVDHCVDLIGMFYALRFHENGPRILDLYAAPGVVDRLTGLLNNDSAMEFREVFRCIEVDAGDTIDVGPFHMELYPALHPVPAVSIRTSFDGTVFTFSGDTAGSPALVEAAEGADTFLCEATWQGPDDAWPDGVHLTGRGAGRVAADAGVGRLLLTHVLGSLDREVTLQEARETFSGEIDLAADNQTWQL